jgi:orotidine-5'-phosphate decarboxylase
VKLETLSGIINEKGSQLCIGLDIKKDDKLEIAKEIIDETAEFAVAYKPNRQFWLGHSIEVMRSLNHYIHKNGCFSIIDHKLSDIGSSSIEGLKYAKSEDFDLITVSPYPGNFDDLCKEALKIEIGIIGLIMMSNPEAKWMVNSPYLDWAKIADKYQANIVVGTTNHVTEDIIESIANEFKSGLVLAPGIGAQGGKIGSLVKYFGERVLFNVSRGISEASNYQIAAKNYFDLIIKSLDSN